MRETTLTPANLIHPFFIVEGTGIEKPISNRDGSPCERASEMNRLWKSVQFPLLRELLGGYESARRVHFFGMAALVAFVVVHLAMVALVPRTFLTMIHGRAPKTP